MTTKMHIVGTGAILLVALIAVAIILVLWTYFGYGYKVVEISKPAIEQVTTTLVSNVT